MSYVIHDAAAGELGTIPIRFAHRIGLPDAFVEVYRVGTSYIGADNTASVLNGLDPDERLYCRPGGGTMLIGLDGIPGPGRPHAMRWELREALAITRHVGTYRPVVPVEELLSIDPVDPSEALPLASAEDLARACAVRIDAYQAVRTAGLERPWHELDSRIEALRAHQARLGHPERPADINPPNRWAVHVELDLLVDADNPTDATARAIETFGRPGDWIEMANSDAGHLPRLAASAVYQPHRPIPHADARLDAKPPTVTDEQYARAIVLANRAAAKALKAGIGADTTERDNAVGLALIDLYGPNRDIFGPQPTAVELGAFRLSAVTDPQAFARAYRDAYAALTGHLGQ